MFKKVLTIIMGLGLAIGAQAQIDPDDILFWVGHGDAHAIVAIQWDEDEVGLAWGVNYDEEVYLSVQDALDTIALYDPRFNYRFSRYGSAGTIMGFSSLNYDDGTLSLSKGNTETPCVWVEDYSADPSDWDWDAAVEEENGIILISTGCYQSYTGIEPVDPISYELPTDATIAFSDILYWVGEGSDSAALIVNFGIPDTAFAWGYRFNGSATVQQMTDAITAADPRFWVVGLPSLYPQGDIFFIIDNGDTLKLSGRDEENPGNYWEALINGGVSYSGASQTLVNGDVFKYGDQRAASRVCLQSMDYGGVTYCMQSAWPKAPTPVSVPEVTPETPVEATIAASDILYWVGEGQNQAIMAINWADTALAWGYRFDGNKTVANMMSDIAAADPRFSYTTGTYGIDDILFARAEGDTLRKQANSWWGSTQNGVMDGGMSQPLHNNDFEKWAEPAAGIAVDSTYYGEEWGWSYTYVYPMTIHPVSVPAAAPEPIELCTTVYPLPYIEDFSGYTDDQSVRVTEVRAPMPTCWTVLGNGRFHTDYDTTPNTAAIYFAGIGYATSTNSYGCMEVGNPYFALIACQMHNGTYEPGIQGYNNYGGKRFAILPMFDHPLGQTMLTFNRRSIARSGAALMIGYIINDTADFTAVDSLPMDYRITHFDTIHFSDYSNIPENARLTLLWKSVDTVVTGFPSNYYCGLDNVKVELNPNMPEPVPVEATIAASDILYWVGEGQNQAIMAINWPDTALAWGYRFDGNKTVANMVNDITAADPRLSYTTGAYGIDDILFARAEGDTLRKSSSDSWWSSTNNGASDAGMGQPLHNNDFEKWVESTTGIKIDSTWVEAYGGYWEYTYVYPMTIHPVSEPEVTPEVPVEATIAASDILYWVGEGQNQAIMAINWPDTALAWGYRFDGNKTVANMMDDITAADPRLSYTTGAYGIDDILFARAEGDTLRKSSSDSWWSSTNNGMSDAGMGQPLHNNDFEKWAEPAAGVVVDSFSYVWDSVTYWSYIYVYPMTIHPVSVPDTTGTNPQPHPEHGPFCGAVGTEGCDAIDGHSSSIVAWATGVSVVRGLDDIAVPDGPRVIYGSESDAVGPIDFTTTTAVSLGDGGSATVTFAHPIRNGEGPDFAVFENSFNDYFLELGFVEVSTDGERFVRFPATSLTQTETQVVSEVDPTFINNLAGKYRVGYGTPFDLEELRDSTGINIDSIVYVRIVDVVGSINPQYATYDAYGHIVNDPYPTSDPTGNWRSGGFDLTGVAVMYENTNGSSEVAVDATIDQDAILFWTGNGQNSAVIAVNWAAPDTCLAWGVKWNGNATVQDLMDTIVAYDSRFTYTGTGMLSDIIYTADGHTFLLTAESASPWGNYWMYNINGAAAQEMFNTQQVNNGDFVKWGDPNSGIMVDSTNWGYVWTTTVTPVSVPTVGIDDVKVAIEALWPNPTTDVVNVSINRPVKAELYDLNGRSMAAFNLHEGTNVISLAHLNAGVYMLRAEGTVMKVVKK